MRRLSPGTLGHFHGRTTEDNHISRSILGSAARGLLRSLQLVSARAGHPAHTTLLLFRPSPRQFMAKTCVGVNFFQSSGNGLRFRSRIRNSLVRRISGTVSLVGAGCLVCRVSCRNVSQHRAPRFPIRTVERSLVGYITRGSCTDTMPVRVDIFPSRVAF